MISAWEAATVSEPKGDHVISDEVIATIASNVVMESEDLSIPTSITDGIVEKLGKKNYFKGIKVDQQEEGIKLEVKILAEYGTSIPQACAAVRDQIIDRLENLTGINVVSVDMHVVGVTIPDSPAESD